MPGKRRAVGEQLEFLEGHLDEYKSLNLGTKKYTVFFAKIRGAWFQQWPEIDILYPGKTVNSLTDDEAHKVSTAMDERIKVFIQITVLC